MSLAHSLQFQSWLVLLVFYFMYIHALATMRWAPRCHHYERRALVQFKQDFIVDCARSSKPAIGWPDLPTWTVKPIVTPGSSFPKVNSWGDDPHHHNQHYNKTNTNCCTWDGVKCDQITGHVIGLDLSSSCLYGKFPHNSTLFSLFHLQSLNLAGNNFISSSIPSQIGHLFNLRSLNLSYSVFSGQIPIEISQLSRLSSLDLSNNVDPVTSKPLLSLHDPSFEKLVYNLTGLAELYLDNTDVSSSVPSVLTNITSLRSISLSYCGLQGEFPSGVFQLRNLELLVLPYNENLKGFLPDGFQWNGALRKLDLSYTLFFGVLPPSIGKLSFLDTLILEGTLFSGPIPSSLGNLTKLTVLNLGKNTFSGEIPSSFANLTQLTIFELTNNLLTTRPGSFSWLPKLHKVTRLGLREMNIVGEVPSFLANLTQIQDLDLSSNQLIGSIPSWILNLTQLQSLHLGKNKLQGPIPLWVSQLHNLVALDLSGNMFANFNTFLKLKNLQVLYLSGTKLTFSTVTTANSTIASTKFKLLDLSSCNLNGFPHFLHNQDKLQFIDLSHNNIQGQIPLWLLNNNVETLSTMHLSFNSLEGFEQPQVWFQHSRLVEVYLNNNVLDGSLPLPSKNIMIYKVSNNKISGVIPPQICNLSSLAYLDISNNEMEGRVPACLGDLGGSLSMLNLRGNKFSGSIPQTYSKSCKLKMINLSENQLVGELPRSLTNCKMLEVLDIGKNQINDTFPSWLGDLPKLHILTLRYNNFHGPIGKPASTLEFSQLRIIDLSHNYHTGVLPSDYVQNWQAMKTANEDQPNPSQTRIAVPIGGWASSVSFIFIYLSYPYTITITNKGSEMLFPKILNVFRVIDFSSNKFEGRIPDELGDLKGVQTLNLSNNNLNDEIPKSLSFIKDLESLDLSQNKLKGKIPPELMQITSLEVFNVSYNDLSGLIPQGKQPFDNSSFVGNSGLCGSPLSRSCVSGNGSARRPLNEDDESDDSLHLSDWIVRVLGYGSGLLVGLISGKFLTDWKHDWFVDTFEKMKPRRRKVTKATRTRS